MITAPNVGEVLLLKYMLNNTAPTDINIHLYTNNVTPAESDVLGTYTEATDPAYLAVSCPGASWTFATVLGTSSATHANISFSFSTTASIYGAYATDSTNTYLLFSERFTAAPLNFGSSGGNIELAPSISLE